MTENQNIETGWLIEIQPEGKPPMWAAIKSGMPHRGFVWVFDASRALRFARKIDAEDCIRELAWFRKQAFKSPRATEHQWG